MKKLLLCLLFSATFVSAKAQFEEEGHVYYDSAQTQLKEVYHFLLRYTVSINRATGDTIINPVAIPIRHGSCILYRKDGTIEATGQYKDGLKSGMWQYYDALGKNVIRDEKY